MPTSVYLCAGGCGAHCSALSDFHERGIVYPRYYCDACVEQADAYLKERDEIHTQIATDWQEGLAEVARDLGFEKGKLPDQ